MGDASDLTFRTAGAADAQAIHDLLERSGLPTSDLDTACPEFVVAERTGKIIGVGALEPFGTAALLRSVAVEPQWRGAGAGSSEIPAGSRSSRSRPRSLAGLERT